MALQWYRLLLFRRIRDLGVRAVELLLQYNDRESDVLVCASLMAVCPHG
jgi:hypothetical protein